MKKWLLAPSRPLDLTPIMYTHTHTRARTYMYTQHSHINGIFLLLLSFFEWMFTRVNSDDITDDTRTIYILGLHKVRKFIFWSGYLLIYIYTLYNVQVHMHYMYYLLLSYLQALLLDGEKLVFGPSLLVSLL